MSVYRTSLSLLLAQLCVLGAARSAETSDGTEFRSDYTYSQEAAGWLKLHRVPLDWQTARLQCFHEGAVLASPLDAALWSALTTIIKTNLDSTLVHSGVSATFNDGVYSSVEGVPLEQLYIQWGKNQPDNDGDEQCLAYYMQHDKVSVYDESCKKLLPYICYRAVSTPNTLTECGTVDQGYQLEAHTQHCYKFHELALPWTLASRVCRAEGGYLVDIESQGEANLLVNLYGGKSSLHSVNQNLALVGFKKWDDKSWWTIHGQRLDEDRSSFWLEGEPSSYGQGEKCASMILNNGKINDVSCDEPVAYICEKHRDSLLKLKG